MPKVKLIKVTELGKRTERPSACLYIQLNVSQTRNMYMSKVGMYRPEPVSLLTEGKDATTTARTRKKKGTRQAQDPFALRKTDTSAA